MQPLSDTNALGSESAPDAPVALESVLCTEELDRRPHRLPDYESENRALVKLAQALADSPRNILQTLADTILATLNSDSAGVSLITDDGGRFYWPAISGAWKAHIGGGTPRNFGPCGDVLDRNIPLMFGRFQRRYTYFKPVQPQVEEAILVPFHIEGKAVGTIWAVAHTCGRRFDAEDMRQLESMGRFASAAYQAVLSIKGLEQEGNALRDSERQFREMIDALPAAIYTTDAHGHLTHFNPACVEFSGRTPVLGSDHWCVTWKLYYPDGTPMPHDACPMAIALKEGRIIRGAEAIAERPDGTRVWFEPYPTTLQDSNGKIIGGINMLVDITERKQVEERLREAKQQAEAASRAKDMFLAVLSHELRTPLAPVFMTLSALELKADLPPDMRQDVTMMRRNVELEVKLIDDLLDISRITSGKLQLQFDRIDINEILRHVCEICRPNMLEKGIRLHCDLDAGADLVVGDQARLQQVFWNLLNNAAKFTPEGGDIHLATRGINDDEQARIQVTVRDSGMGIAPDFLPRIFDAFEQGELRITRQFGGIGLGLAISKMLVEWHRGTIRAESEGKNKGATLVVELPALSRGNSTSVDSQLQPDAGTSAVPLRLMVVEDHADTAVVLGKLLTASGHAVRTATTAAAALALAREHHFDVVISDVGLPDMTGYELMKELKARYGIKGIAMSGYGMEEDIKKGEQAGFSAHLVKPVNMARLEASIRHVAAEGIGDRAR
ncbi:MAG TPA: ATP-binding protein [Humisphaera sp.]|jgi:PAS domain S-box-containing protein|nr:ATP-binding protein [Humisphaera sp.]